MLVAPHAGAWIETLGARDILPNVLSRLMQARGLKQKLYEEVSEFDTVAPHAGAWIETMITIKVISINTVAPHAGAWIETQTLPMYVGRNLVAPHAGAWIETLQG